jgi:hypothetical protein
LKRRKAGSLSLEVVTLTDCACWKNFLGALINRKFGGDVQLSFVWNLDLLDPLFEKKCHFSDLCSEIAQHFGKWKGAGGFWRDVWFMTQPIWVSFCCSVDEGNNLSFWITSGWWVYRISGQLCGIKGRWNWFVIVLLRGEVADE